MIISFAARVTLISVYLIAACGILVKPARAATVEPGADVSASTKESRQANQPEGSGTSIYLPIINTVSEDAWPMAGGNLERTSWTPTEVKGNLHPRWYKTIEPYVSPRFQVVAANSTIFVSSARGLYAFNADNGSEKWVFPTEVPLGNSPTISGGVAYVGGLDRKLYAINAATGTLLWSFEAGGGFDTNPVVVGDKVFAGNRDGKFYAVHTAGPDRGQLAWSYQTGGGIHLSAAYKEGVLYFASDDMHAYALGAHTGALVWISEKLPGSGFRSWWPVVYGYTLVLTASSAYRVMVPPGELVSGQHQMETDCLYPSGIPGNQLMGTNQADGGINLATAANCLENNPWRRTVIILNRQSGQEVTFNFDNDGKADYAPFFWFGTRAGNRYPPVVSKNGTFYISAPYVTSGPDFLRGLTVAWQFGTPSIYLPSANTKASDEPVAYSIGGNVLYWSHCCDRSSWSVDLSKPNPGYIDGNREWRFYDEGGLKLPNLIPGYKVEYYSEDLNTVFGGSNGVYGLHGDQSPPVPYRGKVYMIRSNTLVAFDSSTAPAVHLPTSVTRPATTEVPIAVDELRASLQAEVQKMLDAGHLRPGYGITGNFDRAGRFECGEYLLDYFHDPSDSILTLLLAIPHLPPEMQANVRDYIQSEMTSFSPFQVVNIGWQSGASRDYFDLPPEIDAGRASFSASEWLNFGITYWKFQPHLYYTLWKYAQEFPGTARQLFDAAVAKAPLPATPSNALLAQHPYVHNSFIAGYTGFLNLQEMAGYNRDAGRQNELNRLLSLRASSFSKDSPFGVIPGIQYCKTTSISRNFQYLTPELGQYLHDHALPAVQTAVNEYNRIAPYWFVSNFEATYAEGAFQPLQDVSGMFQAKGLILQESYSSLVKYLDAPAFPVGDLFYMQNLITAIEAGA